MLYDPAATFMVFDVESIGLHGEGFAVGWKVIDRRGHHIAAAEYACDPNFAKGFNEDRKWADDNVKLTFGVNCSSPRCVRDMFWDAYVYAMTMGATLWAECLWPVEANFLNACIADAPEMRKTQGPYPIHEIATVRALAGFGPTIAYPRHANELPIHNPLNDARQSARLLIEALYKLEGKT